jgi:prepilin-type N-terminal cleavage/methylation domain-containing protein
MSSSRSEHRRLRRGVTIVELLIAMTVLVIVLGIATFLFARHAQLQRNVQARSDVQDRVRMVAQLVTQDLALAGTPLRITADGRIDQAAPAAGCAQSGGLPLCVQVTRDSDTLSTLRVRYVSTQFASADACRSVAYRVQNGTLQRSDVRCGQQDAFLDLAPQTLGFRVVVICSDGSRVDAFGAGTCGAAAYGRSSVISIVAENTVRGSPTSAAPALVAAQGTVPVTCGTDRLCFGVSHEVLMPNLKDR